MRPFARAILVLASVFGLWLLSSPAYAQKVYLNPSDQTENSVSGGGNEAQYALINANIAKDILTAAGFTPKVDQDFYNAPSNANSWGADIFVSIHTNAGGGHGTETLYKSTGGQNLAGKIQNGLLSKLPYQDRGLKYRDDLHVLNATDMYACLLEAVFHDCTAGSGYAGHPPSESAFLRSADGQKKIGAGIAAGVCSYYGKTCDATTPAKGTLRGVVFKDPNLDDRIAGATVKLNTGASAVTPADGSWSFELDPGDYTATATADGYAPNSQTRTVVAGETVWGSIGLSPAQPPGPDAGPDVSAPDAKPDQAVADVITISEASTDANAEASPKSDWNASDDGGCGCKTTGPRPHSLLLVAVGAAFLAASRRRRA